MAKRKFKKYTAEERKKLGLDKMPDSIYDPQRHDLKTPVMEELPVNYGEIRDDGYDL